MVIDVHCHVGYSARRVDHGIERFSFERDGAVGSPGFDSYLSPRLLARPAWYFVKRWLGIDPSIERGEALDRRIEAVNESHWSNMPGVDRLVLLAFDEYYDSSGRVIGMAERSHRFGSDLYVANSFVRDLCCRRPDLLLFGASIHPYRADAIQHLAEVASAGAKLIKWLPIHQNIDICDERSVEFLRAAARFRVPMLIHYGGEMSLSRQHMEFESALPLLDVLRRLRSSGVMPTVIVAHVSTPSFPWQDHQNCLAFVEALTGEFRDEPLYADISALAAFGRTGWLSRFARNNELQAKLVWGSDYPIPVLTSLFWRHLSRVERKRLAAISSWIERDLQLKRTLGFDDAVFTRAARLFLLPEGEG